MPKFNRHAREKRKTAAGVRGVSPVGGKVEEFVVQILIERKTATLRFSAPFEGLKSNVHCSSNLRIIRKRVVYATSY